MGAGTRRGGVGRLIAATALGAALLVGGIVYAPPPAAAALPAPRMTFAQPRIATRKWDPIYITGTIKEVSMNPSDRLVVKLYHWEDKQWKFVRDVRPSRKRTGSFSAKWWATIRAGERGHWKAFAVVRAWDGRYQRTMSRTVRFRAVNNNYVALTFDDGSWTYTDAVRSALDRNGVKATFFMVGRHTRWYPGPAKRVAAAGHQVANHSQNHPMLTSLSSNGVRRELGAARSTLKSITGRTTTWYRPPGGATNSRVRRAAASVGMREMMWTVDTGDWKGVSSWTIRRRAVNGARPGGVILMHDGGGRRASTAAAVPGIIRDLKAKKYDFVTVDERAAIRYQ